MSVWEALILGIVQGATEFLPVSSSGHLVVGQELLGINAPGVGFEIAVHVATLLSVVVVYRERLLRLLGDALKGVRSAWAYVGMLVIATIPAAVVGLGFEDRISALFDAPWTVAVAFAVTGGLLWSTRRALARDPSDAPTFQTATAMGLAQAFALIPGISRSGTTVVTGLWSKVDPKEAAAFSFLMSIPAISGAAILKAPEILESGDLALQPLIVGGIAAAVTGVLAIRSFVALLDKRSFYQFAFYLWPVAALFLIYLRLRG